MKHFLDENLGRILFVLAILWSLTAALLNRDTGWTFTGEDRSLDRERIQVKLELEKIAAAEGYFPAHDAAHYLGAKRFVFVPEKKEFKFKAVDLDIPPPLVMRPPMVLPDPGPALEGTHDLPRWGEGLPALVAPAPEPKKKTP